MCEFLKSIAEGIGPGVGSGLVLALIFWLGNCLLKWFRRKNQLEYISKLIVSFRENINHPDRHFSDLSPLAYAAMITYSPPLQERRKNSYEFFRKQLESALDGRADQLTFDEIELLRITFLFEEFIWLDSDGNPTKEWYDHIFEWAESRKWLNIPPIT